MGDITVKIDAANTIAALRALRTRIDIATERATDAIGKDLQAAARANFVGSHARGEWHVGGDRPNIVSGNLQRSITTWPVVPLGDARYSVKVGPTAIYSRVIELGDPNITPTTAPFLAWTGRRSDGSWGLIQRRSVSVSPHPYFRPGYEQTVARMRGVFADYWSGAILG